MIIKDNIFLNALKPKRLKFGGSAKLNKTGSSEVRG